MRFLVALWVGCFCGAVFATPDVLSGSEANAMVKRIATASRKVSFAGTYLHQHGAELETFRVARVLDADGEYEKREPLEGAAREIVRANGQISCYLPEPPANPADVKRNALTKMFPALINEDALAALGYFSVSKLANERVAGFDAQVLLLEPKDGFRYGRKLWFDPASGVLLKAATVSRKNEVMELYAFTELSIGNIDRKHVKPRYAHRIDLFTPDRARVEPAKPQAESAWEIRNIPAGYRIVRESKVTVGNRVTPISHIWLSDGWGAVSVFVEALAARPADAPTVSAPKKSSITTDSGKAPVVAPHVLINQGVVNVYSRSVADSSVTVMGDVPEAVVTAIGHGLVQKADGRPSP